MIPIPHFWGTPPRGHPKKLKKQINHKSMIINICMFESISRFVHSCCYIPPPSHTTQKKRKTIRTGSLQTRRSLNRFKTKVCRTKKKGNGNQKKRHSEECRIHCKHHKPPGPFSRQLKQIARPMGHIRRLKNSRLGHRGKHVLQTTRLLTNIWIDCF